MKLFTTIVAFSIGLSSMALGPNPDEFAGKWCLESKAHKKHKPGTFKSYYMELLPGGFTFIGCGADMKGYWKVEGDELIFENKIECFTSDDEAFLLKHGFEMKKKGNWPNCGLIVCTQTKDHEHYMQQTIYKIEKKSEGKMVLKLDRETYKGETTIQFENQPTQQFVLIE